MTNQQGMVAAAHPLACKVGCKVLKSGGNAVDAAVSTALALNVVEPYCSGLGGGGFALIFMNDNPSSRTEKNPCEVISFRPEAPLAATPDLYYDESGLRWDWLCSGGRAVAVPTAVSGFFELLKRYGTRSFGEVAEGAIRLAHDGFPVSEKLSVRMKAKEKLLARFEASSKIYLNQRMPFAPAEILRNPDLARTLERISEEGLDLFYRGEIAQAIIETIQSQGGVMILQDLDFVKSDIQEPVWGGYRGYDLFSVPPPSSGGISIIQLLKVIEHFDVAAMGSGSVQWLHTLVEALKWVFADRERYMADPKFWAMPTEELVESDYIHQLANRINPDRAVSKVSPGEFKSERKSGNTTHLSVVDRWGNAVAMTITINNWFGSGMVVPGYGFLLNDEMADFSFDEDSPNRVEGGKRPLSSMAPTLLTKDGNVFLSLGSAGAERIISALVQVITGVIDFNLDLNSAIDFPRCHSMSSKSNPSPVYVESRFSNKTLRGLKELGHQVIVKGDYDPYFGGVQGILVDPNSGCLKGGADSQRRDGAYEEC